MWQHNVQGKRILVIGAARSGRAVANFLSQRGALVTLTDNKPIEELAGLTNELGAVNIKLVLGQDPVVKPRSFHYAVISPGVPLDIPLVAKLNQTNIPLIGELELASQYAQSLMVAITGTNGKTTTTTLLGEILKDAGRSVFVGGNIGIPLVTALETISPQTVLVAEVSSFQLETVKDFRPQVAVILNLTPDHLDRHKTMDAYIEAKAQVFVNQRANDLLIANYDDLLVRNLAEKSLSRVIYFSQDVPLIEGVFIEEGRIYVKRAGVILHVIKAEDIYIKGKHNLENVLAAVAAASSLGIPHMEIAKTLAGFKGVAHRQEFVLKWQEVSYINDSKGTNPEATIKALMAFSEPINLIAGGYNKGSDFTDLAQVIKKRVRNLILVGDSAPLLKEAVQKQGVKNIYETQDFSETVPLAERLAVPGDIVLLSPACASWDMFDSFEARGDLFKKLVHQLGRKKDEVKEKRS